MGRDGAVPQLLCLRCSTAGTARRNRIQVTKASADGGQGQCHGADKEQGAGALRSA